MRILILLLLLMSISPSFADEPPASPTTATASHPFATPVSTTPPVDFGSLPNPSVALPGLLYTQDMIDKAIQRGKDVKKSWSDILKPYRQNPVWTIGKSGKAPQSFVWIMNLDALPITQEVWQATKLYEPVKVDAFRKPGYVCRMLQFVVHLETTLKTKFVLFRGMVPVDANSEDVHVMKFVLSDDHGNNIASDEQVAGAVQTGTQTFTGTTAIPTFGTAAIGGLTSSWTSTEFIPYSEAHPYYTASYRVGFDLYDDKDNLLLSPDTKSVTLRIITSTGEQDVVYNLTK